MILVFGKTGQVALELQRLGKVTALGRDEADLSDPVACADAIHTYAPTTVINAAAYTAVDKAESDEETAHIVNAVAPAAMARACIRMRARLLHISTDYVFDGSGDTPFAPGDPTGPLGAYGRTKLAGERAIEHAGGAHVILRTSWVFSAHGANFVKTMLRLGADRERINVVADQIGGPTPAAAIAAALLKIAATDGPDGTYHLAGAPFVSWADLAREVFARAGLATQVTDIPTSDYPTPARRPLNSRLDCASLARDYGIDPPDWRAGLDDVLAALRK